jgi:hypothetical protein
MIDLCIAKQYLMSKIDRFFKGQFHVLRFIAIFYVLAPIVHGEEIHYAHVWVTTYMVKIMRDEQGYLEGFDYYRTRQKANNQKIKHCPFHCTKIQS